MLDVGYAHAMSYGGARREGAGSFTIFMESFLKLLQRWR